jgi:hypothetical protein
MPGQKVRAPDFQGMMPATGQTKGCLGVLQRSREGAACNHGHSTGDKWLGTRWGAPVRDTEVKGIRQGLRPAGNAGFKTQPPQNGF